MFLCYKVTFFIVFNLAVAVAFHFGEKRHCLHFFNVLVYGLEFKMVAQRGDLILVSVTEL